jgi:prefoldin subunit 5
MSRGASSVFVLFLVLALTAFFFFSSSLLPGGDGLDADVLKELTVKRFTSLGNSIAHAAFVEDAVIMADEANLTEIITRVKNDEPEITFMHITNADNEVLVSTDPAMVGKTYDADVSTEGSSTVTERNGVYEGGFSIEVSKTEVGFLYFGANPRVSAGAFSASGNPVVIIVGVVVAVIAFLVTLLSKRRTKAKLIDEVNRRQEEIFSPKIEALKNAQSDAQSKLQGINDKLRNAEQELQKFTEEYEVKKKEAENNPLVQSIEKLKASESDLMKRIEKLKEEEGQLNTEISLLSQKRQEVLNALEAEKKEERTLHEKLDLIKKKILHLETPGK